MGKWLGKLYSSPSFASEINLLILKLRNSAPRELTTLSKRLEYRRIQNLDIWRALGTRRKGDFFKGFALRISAWPPVASWKRTEFDHYSRSLLVTTCTNCWANNGFGNTKRISQKLALRMPKHLVRRDVHISLKWTFKCKIQSLKPRLCMLSTVSRIQSDGHQSKPISRYHSIDSTD